MADTTDVLAAITGWIYFFAWSISFYPQVFLNYKRKSTDGFSVEFATLNPQGFFFYSLYTVAGFIDPVKSKAGTPELNDVFFALHAFILSSIQLSQIFVYDKSMKGEQKKLVMWPVILIAFEWLFVLSIFFVEISGVKMDENIQFLRATGYCKALITFVKYMPQVYSNYKRKSTEGWSIANIMLDFTGGLFSVLQDVIKAVGHGESPFSGGGFNIVKWMLGIMSIIFDLIFMF